MSTVESRALATAKLHGGVLQNYGALIALIVLVAFNCIFTENFMSRFTIWNLVIQASTIVILALGMTTVIATGGIDISVGSVMALSAMVAAKFIAQGHIALGIAAAVATAVVCGLISGTIVMKYNVQPMITTLAMMYALRGLAKLSNNATALNYKNAAFSNVAYFRIGREVPIQLVVVLIVTAVIYVVMRKTWFGTYVEAYGNNPRAAKVAGIPTALVVVGCYVICAVLACISGLMEAALVRGVDPVEMGLTKEADAIAATAVGGTLMTGGRPNVLGTVCGAFALQLISMMVNMNNIPYSYSLILKMLIIVVAVYIQNINRRRN